MLMELEKLSMLLFYFELVLQYLLYVVELVIPGRLRELQMMKLKMQTDVEGIGITVDDIVVLRTNDAVSPVYG